MGKIYIKQENGQKVAYEEGAFLDRKIGALYEKWDGSYETRNITGDNVTIDSNYRTKLNGDVEGTFNDQEGVFSDRHFLDNDRPTFQPNPAEPMPSEPEERAISDNRYHASTSATIPSPKTNWIKPVSIIYWAIVLFAIVWQLIFIHGDLGNTNSLKAWLELFAPLWSPTTSSLANVLIDSLLVVSLILLIPGMLVVLFFFLIVALIASVGYLILIAVGVNSTSAAVISDTITGIGLLIVIIKKVWDKK